MFFETAGGNALRPFDIADQTDFSFRKRLHNRNLNNLAIRNVFCGKFFRQESNSKIMLYHR